MSKSVPSCAMLSSVDLCWADRSVAPFSAALLRSPYSSVHAVAHAAVGAKGAFPSQTSACVSSSTWRWRRWSVLAVSSCASSLHVAPLRQPRPLSSWARAMPRPAAAASWTPGRVRAGKAGKAARPVVAGESGLTAGDPGRPGRASRQHAPPNGKASSHLCYAHNDTSERRTKKQNHVKPLFRCRMRTPVADAQTNPTRAAYSR